MNETAYRTEMDKMRLEGLRKMCGYVEDGSSTCITIGQDDCTRTWCLTVGYHGPLSRERHYYGYNFNGVIDAALEAELGNQK